MVTNDPANPTKVVSLSGTGYASYPVPTITSFDKPTIPTGSSTVTIQVYGTNFFSWISSANQWEGPANNIR